jgi:hypothetical protein
MKFKNLIKSTLLATTIFASLNSSAVEMDEASWYLNVDLTSIKQSPLKSIMDHKDKDLNKAINIFMGNEFHDQIDQITLYGETKGFEDFSVLIQGDFTENAKHQFFSHPQIKLDENYIKFNNTKIHQWSINENTKIIGMEEEINFENHKDKEFDLYLTELSPRLIMLSRDLADAKRWIDNDYSINDISENGVFSVIVNLQEALAHGGMKIEDGEMDFHSKILSKVSQLSFSIIEGESEYIFEAALAAEDEATALQVEQVLNGLLALNALSNSNDNPLHGELMKQLKIEKSDLNLLISTSASSDLVINYIMQKHSH